MRFENVSVIIPTLRETESFLQTIDTILDSCEHQDLKEFLIMVCDATTERSMEYILRCKARVESMGICFRIERQQRPYLGGALVDGFLAAKGSHLVVETADLNTAPENLASMIELAKQYPMDVISCSRWLKGSGFENYQFVKRAWNYCSQKLLQALYMTRLSDFTWGTHLVPSALYQAIDFQERKHPIAVEEAVIPLRLGIAFHEIPGICHVDESDVSVQPLWANVLYLRPAFKWRFAKKEKMLRKGVDYDDLINRLRG